MHGKSRAMAWAMACHWQLAAAVMPTLRRGLSLQLFMHKRVPMLTMAGSALTSGGQAGADQLLHGLLDPAPDL